MAKPDPAALEGFLRAVCPDSADSVLDDVRDEVLLTIAALPPLAARGVTTALVALDHLTRFSRAGRGRRFRHLAPREQRDVVERALAGREPCIPSQVVVPLRALAVMAYYDHPHVRRSLGYRPEAWVAEATARRLRALDGPS